MKPRSDLLGDADVLWIPAPPTSGSQSMDRYWRELVIRMRERGDCGLAFRSFLPGPPAESWRAGRLPRAWQRYMEYPLRARLAAKSGVFHLLDHSHAHVLPWLRGKGKRIVTVHDLLPLRDAGDLSRTQVERFRRTVLHLREADLILTDSDFTAGEVRELLGADCPPMRTVLLGVDVARFRQPVTEMPGWLQNANPNVPICLCVGSGLARKNLRILPELLAEALKSVSRLALLKIGSGLEGEVAMALRKLEPRLQVIQVPHATERELVAAYQRAKVLLFPSLLEGFGLPVLEAMAAGTPVVASNATSIPEVGLDACRYFDPRDAKAGAREVVAVLQDGALRAEMIAKGKGRAAALDWTVHFEKLCAIYKEIRS